MRRSPQRNELNSRNIWRAEFRVVAHLNDHSLSTWKIGVDRANYFPRPLSWSSRASQAPPAFHANKFADIRMQGVVAARYQRRIALAGLGCIVPQVTGTLEQFGFPCKRVECDEGDQDRSILDFQVNEPARVAIFSGDGHVQPTLRLDPVGSRGMRPGQKTEERRHSMRGTWQARHDHR